MDQNIRVQAKDYTLHLTRLLKISNFQIATQFSQRLPILQTDLSKETDLVSDDFLIFNRDTITPPLNTLIRMLEEKDQNTLRDYFNSLELEKENIIKKSNEQGDIRNNTFKLTELNKKIEVRTPFNLDEPFKGFHTKTMIPKNNTPKKLEIVKLRTISFQR